MSVDIGVHYGVHPRQAPTAACLEPIDNVAVEPQMHRSLAARHDDASLFPEFLPERFRLPMVLCYLEGMTRDQAADYLRCTEGSVRGRLAKGSGSARLSWQLPRREARTARSSLDPPHRIG